MKMYSSLMILTLLSALPLFAQTEKESLKLMNSNDIKQIEEYLKTSHPEDPRNRILKKRLVQLKNIEWTKGKYTAKPMAARPLDGDKQESSIIRPNLSPEEQFEFSTLYKETPDEHKGKTVKLLNSLFDQNKNKKEAILLARNSSDCNIILRIKGKKTYALAIPSKGENSIVIDKDSYVMTSNVCNIGYLSTKEIKKNTLLTLTPTQILSNNLASKIDPTIETKKTAIK